MCRKTMLPSITTPCSWLAAAEACVVDTASPGTAACTTWLEAAHGTAANPLFDHHPHSDQQLATDMPDCNSAVLHIAGPLKTTLT